VRFWEVKTINRRKEKFFSDEVATLFYSIIKKTPIASGDGILLYSLDACSTPEEYPFSHVFWMWVSTKPSGDSAWHKKYRVSIGKPLFYELHIFHKTQPV